MRDDLLDAKAAVDWAVAQIRILHRRISRWLERGPYFAVTVPDTQPGKELVKVKEREPIPPAVNAETGAVINMLRTSLDLLAVRLAERNGHMRPKDVYFPITSSVLDFIDPIDGAIKKLKRLSEADRLAVEQLRPYPGGDDRIYSLHLLDQLRKQQRLVVVSARPRSMGLINCGSNSEPEFLYNGKLEDGTALFRLPSGTNAKVDLRIEVTFNETPFANGRPVVTTLRDFATRTQEIIAKFDRVGA
jgi:hypothetical protein